MTETKQKRNILAGVGIIIGFLAIASAFLSPWIAEAIDPPPKPTEEALVDLAVKIKQAAEAKVKGEQYQPATTAEQQKPPSHYLPPAVIAVAMLGVAFGLGSFLVGENKSLSGVAVTLGVAAAVVQWSIILFAILATLIVILIIIAIIGAIGG